MLLFLFKIFLFIWYTPGKCKMIPKTHRTRTRARKILPQELLFKNSPAKSYEALLLRVIARNERTQNMRKTDFTTYQKTMYLPFNK
jgi:hypothetical protein